MVSFNSFLFYFDDIHYFPTFDFNIQDSVCILYFGKHLFFPTENMVISPAGNFKYEWLNAPRNRAALVFELRSSTSGPSHVALSDTRYPTERMYQLVLGDSGNSVSWIGRGKHGKFNRIYSKAKHKNSKLSFRVWSPISKCGYARSPNRKSMENLLAIMGTKHNFFW